MRPTITLTALLALIVGPLLAANPLDPKATTLHLDKAGTAVSVAREGAFVRLVLREAAKDKTDPSGVVVLLSDSSVRLTRADARRVADLLTEAAETKAEDYSGEVKASPFMLVANREANPFGQLTYPATTGNVCDGDSCRVAPARAATRRNLSQPAAPGYSRPRFARRVLGRVGRAFGRCGRGGCCR